MGFNQPEFYINRELSWLKFNERVLSEASYKDQPILERLKFVSIFSSNLDEFFMVRVGTLKNQLEEKQDGYDPSGMSVSQQLNSIAKSVHKLVRQQYRTLNQVMKELEKDQLCFIKPEALTVASSEWLHKYFDNMISPVLTPLAVDASHPFPFLSNRSLNLAVSLLDKNKNASVAVIQVPAVLPRILEVPAEKQRRLFVFLEDVIQLYCSKLFHGYRIKSVVPFRITRNADFLIDEEDTENLLEEVQRSIRRRKRGRAVRLELFHSKNKGIKKFLLEELHISENDLYELNGPLDLTCFGKFCEIAGYEHLRHQPVQSYWPQELDPEQNLFDSIRNRDILLHHPYESFSSVIDFVRVAAEDPQVLAIKQTLYRVSGNSPIVRALAQAAENGKQVTVVVEILARFDEENNILWARRLEEAGCHVIYGLVGLKTHAKICLVVRREDGGIRRYVHMSTGNYNDSTAKIYTDIGLFTANDQFGADASGFFNVLTGYSDPPIWNKISVAPEGLREKTIELIQQEIAYARAGKSAKIIAKMNSLVDKEIIAALYEASCAGVSINLIVRGICVLRPGISGISDNITVRSIVGRFLEHSRIFYFFAAGEEKCYLSSADWMPRNLNSRVEILFPVEADAHRQRIYQWLQLLLSDNQKSHEMKPNGNYRRIQSNKNRLNAQNRLLEQARQHHDDISKKSWETKSKFQPILSNQELTDNEMEET